MSAVWGGEVAEGEDLKFSDIMIYVWSAICASAAALLIVNLRGR